MGLESTIVELPITIRGETRVVPFVHYTYDGHECNDRNMSSKAAVGLFSKGSGNKHWPHRLTVWKEKDGSWRLSEVETILNRYGYRLIGWADKAKDFRLSNHNSAYNAPGVQS